MANIRLTANERAFVNSMDNAAGSVGRLSASLNIQLARAMRDTDNISRNFAQGFGRIGDTLKSVGQSMSAYITLPLSLAGGAALKAYGDLDSLKRGLLSIEGTLPNVEKRLLDLGEAAKMPGLGFQEAIQGDIRLRSVGIAAETSMRILKEFGNANALTGGGKEKLSEIITQLTQMAAKGKVAAQDLKPIIEAAPSVSTAIRQMFGTVDSESIQKTLTSMGKSSSDFINDLLGALEKAPRVAGGFKNAMENVSDSLFKFAAGFGESINKSFGLEEILNNLSTKLSQITIYFQSLSPEIQKLILGFAGIIAIAGPLMVAVGGIIKAYALLFTGTIALTAAISGIALAVGGLVYLYIDYQATQTKIANASKTLAQLETEVKNSIHAQAEEVRKHTDVLNDNNSTLAQRKTAIEALKTISPEYFGKLDSEKIKYDDLNLAVSKYITNLENAAKANVLKAQIDASVKAETDIMNNPESVTSGLKKIGLRYFDNLVEPGAYDKAIKAQADDVIEKIKLSREPIKKELADLLKLGYKPTETPNTTPPPLSKIDLSGKEIVKKLFEGITVKQIESEYAGDTIEEVIEKLRQRLDKGLRHAFQTFAETDYIKSQNTSFPIEKVISFSERDVMASINLLNEKFKNLYTKIDIFPKPMDLSAQAQATVDLINNIANDLAKNVLPNALAGVFESIGNGDGLAKGLGNAFKSILSTIGSYMIELGKKTLVATSLIEGLKKAFGTVAGPAASIALIVGGGLLKGLANSLFSQTPKFANGGIISGPTLGLMGEYAGARSNPEVIAPLSKLKDLLGNSSGSIGVGEIKLRGEDLYISLQRYNNRVGN
jgi:tape measure domain-containing protein